MYPYQQGQQGQGQQQGQYPNPYAPPNQPYPPPTSPGYPPPGQAYPPQQQTSPYQPPYQQQPQQHTSPYQQPPSAYVPATSYLPPTSAPLAPNPAYPYGPPPPAAYPPQQQPPPISTGYPPPAGGPPAGYPPQASPYAAYPGPHQQQQPQYGSINAAHASYGTPPMPTQLSMGQQTPHGYSSQASSGALVSPPFSPVPGTSTSIPNTPGSYTSPPIASPRENGFLCGPLLRYQNLDLHQGNWLGSILIVTGPQRPGEGPPRMQWYDQQRPNGVEVVAQPIDSYNQAVFWRFSLVIPQDVMATKRVTYTINGHGPQYMFFIAGRNETFKWMFYSCNGFSSATDSVALGGKDPMWNDAVSKHIQQPYHVMIGGGDQLYCDGLLNEPEMEEWLAVSNLQEKEKMQCKPNWTTAIEKYYFNRYCQWFTEGTYAKALTMIPSVNMWDDHDILDGFGSYPASMMTSPTMTTIGAVARRFYLLFQQHSTQQLLPHHGFFSAGVGDNILTSLGPTTQALVLDARSERTKHVVCSTATYDLAFAKLYREIPEGTKHLLVQLGVPIAYPRLVFAESIMGSVGSVLGSLGGAKKVVNKLNGEPELLDDLNDHWTASAHKQERNKFIVRLQNFANDRKIRVTFISGDVHCAGIGRFSARIEPVETDPQYMIQIISSAIVNEAPPDGVIKLLHFQDKIHNLEGRVKTIEDMMPLFTSDVDGTPLTNNKLLPRRNYCQGQFNHQTGGIDISLFAENVRGGPEGTVGGDRGTKAYTLHIPRLE